MEREMRNKGVNAALTACVMALFFAASAFACTGFYVGKKVSADGSVILGRTVDLSMLGIGHRIAVVPRQENLPGRVYRGINGFEWELPATTWKHIVTPRLKWEGAGEFASVGVNEKGLAITATVTGYVRPEISDAFPAIKTGCAEENMTSVIAASCASASEAVDLIGEIMARRGTNERNIIMVADRREAWLVEIYTGHLWSAMRLPEDKVAGFGNNFILEAYEPGSPDWRGAPDIVTAPQAKGLAVMTKDGKLDLFHTYSGKRNQFANIRNWFAKRMFAPGTEGAFTDEVEFPLIYAPSRKLGVADIFAAMRTRYEGTEWCPDETGREDVRVIGSETHTTSHVIALRDDLPPERSITVWACLGPAEHGVYLPFANCIDEVDEEFARDRTEDRERFVSNLACDAFRRLAALCQTNRRLYGQGVRDFWALREQDLLARWPAVFLRGDPAEMTAFVKREQRRALEDAKILHDELEWNLAAHGLTRRYRLEKGVFKRSVEPRPFVPSALRKLRESLPLEPAIDRSADRVATAPDVPLKRIGTLVPRSVGAVTNANIMLGCETLDRDFADFASYKRFIAPLGIGKIRLQAGWAKCEPIKKRYDFSWLDLQVDYARSIGVQPVLETSYGNPIYTGGGSADLAGGFPVSEEALAAWDAWVEALATHYRKRVSEWLMWNEPDNVPADGSARKSAAEIAAFNVRTAKIIRRVIPDAKIGALSLSECDAKLVEDCVKAMGKDVSLFDWIVYHGYRWAPEHSYGTIEGVKKIVAGLAPNLRLRQGENGCPSEETHRFALDGIPWTEVSQAKWDLRRMLGDLGHDVETSVFTISDFIHKGREKNTKGLLGINNRKQVVRIKPAYYAVQNAVSVFDDTLERVVQPHAAAKDLNFYEYAKRGGGSPLIVFWTSRENGKHVRPGDSLKTHPVDIVWTGRPLKDPVWVDLRTGRVYELPASNPFKGVPVYDSPCLIAERAAIHWQTLAENAFSDCWLKIAENDEPPTAFAIDPSVSKEGCDAYTVKETNGRLVFTGSNDRSLLYAVYDFFARKGCRWFWDGDKLPPKGLVDIAGTDVHEESRFEYRGIRYFAHRGLTRFQCEHWGLEDWKREIDWCLKNRLNVMMLRIGMDDTWQKAFPDIVRYPDPAKPLPEALKGYDNRSLFWSLEERGRLRKALTTYALERGLEVPTDFGTMTHWYSRTPQDYLDKVNPPLLQQATSDYGEKTGLVWDIRDPKWLEEYWKLTDAMLRSGYGDDRFLHTIGFGERRIFKDRAENLKFKIEVNRQLVAKALEKRPDAKVLLAGWDFFYSWAPEEVRELIPHLDPKTTVLWDYEADTTSTVRNFTNWDVVGRFPYTFGIFLCYEMALDVRANYPLIESRFKSARNDPMCKGLIFWPESAHTDTLLLKYFTENAWRPDEKPIEKRLDEFCVDRYGKESAPLMAQCWNEVLPVGRLLGYCGNAGMCLTADPAGACTMKEFHEKGEKDAEFAALSSAPALYARLTTANLDDPSVRRDAVDLARTMLDRQLLEAHYRLATAAADSVKAEADRFVRLWELFAELLDRHEDYSLNDSYERLCGIAPVANPDFPQVLLENCANHYCRSHQAEVVRHWFLPFAHEVADRFRTSAVDGDGLKEICEKMRQRLLEMPLKKMASRELRTTEALRGTFKALERVSAGKGIR